MTGFFRSDPPYHQIPDFAHVLHREADALAAEPRILDSAIGHVVDAVGGDVVDDDAADLQLVPCRQHLMQVAGEKAGLEPELAVVDLGERIVPVGEFRQNGERAEGFLAIRSQEHTSELQSLMRISYAVFCLKKHKWTNTH